MEEQQPDSFNLMPEAAEAEVKKRCSMRRLFLVFLITDIVLFAYLIYAFIMLFMNL